ncbi:hypothetical protein O181_018641 [Austropuccinia psidii MF-1]|uniref:Uncharacterized protein n=1 Tax=Austropuccinia psidii MF-1 TaxID=1389203 RepID=A0A9Q3CA06_9BASI|nr:hypothetical protein [Austropuccinia psidii MF-1]
MIVLNLLELLNHPASIVGRRGFLVFNLLLLGPPDANSGTLGKEISLRPTIISQTIPEDYGASSRRVEDLGWKLLLMKPQLLMPPMATPILSLMIKGLLKLEVFNNGLTPAALAPALEDPFSPKAAPEVPILVTRKDGRLGKLKRNLVVQDENDTDAEGSDEIDVEELEITTPIQKRRIQSTSLSPVQFSTTTHEVIRSPQPP